MRPSRHLCPSYMHTNPEDDGNENGLKQICKYQIVVNPIEEARRGQPFREFNTGGTDPKVKQRVFPTPRESEFEAAVASLDQTLVRRKSENSAAPTTKMYSPGVLQYNSRLTEVTPMENNFVLDLSIRTPEDTNGCHGEGIYTDDRLLSPEIRSNHSGDSNGCNGSPTFLALPASATTRAGKPTRPFKAYPKNFLGLGMTEGIIPDDSNVRYMEFRRQFLSQLHAANGNNGGNKNMKRPVQSVSPNQVPSSSGDAKDQAYWEKRRKNNEAAKKSRDARRAKEDEIAIRAAFLERENLQLRLELASLKGEVERLRCVLYANN